MIVINDNMNNYNFNNLDISLPLNSSGSITSTTVDSQGLNGSPLKSEGNMNHHSSISTGTNDDGDHSNGSHHSNGGGGSSSGSNGGSNGHGKDTKDKKKPIPIELTAYGTTPSGKPRLFVCQDCTRAFARLEHLRRHERSHTKEKPFTCGVCQRKFSRRDLLLRHAQKLHAGCADAITRLRRKSVKKIDTDHDADHDSRSSTNGQPTDKKDVDFNLNLFDNHHSINHQLSSFQNNLHNLSQNNPSIFSNQPGNTNHPVHHQKRRSTSDLSKQMFDKKRTRGASFSAQSGANYAANIPEFNDLYTGTDTGNVEFSTPQLMPSTTFDEPSWLHNLSTIPGMTDDVQHNNPKHHGNTQFNLNQNQNNGNPNNNNKDNNNGSDIPNKGEKSNKNFEKFDLQYMLPTATMNSNDLNNTKDFGFGYSFYDVPDSMVTNDFKHNDFKSNNGLTPIKQEFEEDHFPGMNQLSMHQGQNELPNQNQLHNGKPSQNEQESEGINDIFDVNLNFINDIGELTNEIDVNSKFLPNGYSFYGDSVSSSGFGNSPSYGSPNNFLNQSQILNIDNTNSLNNLKISNYSKFSMFTNNLKNLINKSLNKYPINGSINPIIPSNDKLEIYLSYFKNKFLNKFPFIHPSKLNEYEIMMMTSNEDYSNESARVCLPLLVATVGALLSNNKNDSEHLYEASRRTIHIYLESRKLNNQSKNNNPLWLIQSLTLSVVYGLFSDNENNVFIVIRQLNALNSLVKTSIRDKKNFQIFNINDGIKREGEDNHKEIEFNNLINTQSQFRIIFIIYRITSFLLMFYNIPLTLSVNDLNNLQVPNIEDEIIWKFNNVQDFKNFDPLNLKRYNFKDLLLKISKNANNNNLNSIVELKNLSLFSYSTLIHGVFEINQFNNNLNTINILNNLSKLCNNNDDYVVDGTNINHGVLINNYQLMDYSIIVNLIKISSILDFKLLKQQSWLKNYKELIKVFENLNQSIKLNEFSKIDKILDYSLIILKFLIIKFDKSGDQNDHNNISDPINEDGQEMEDEEDISFENDEVNFEKLINIKFINVLNNDPNIILSQSLFQIFSILSLILIQLIKSPITPFTKQLNAKFFKIFEFCKFIQVNYNLPIIFESPNLNSKKLIFNDVYYLLNIGELLLNHYFSNFFRFSIFEKLSINLYQIRKYLSDNENK